MNSSVNVGQEGVCSGRYRQAGEVRWAWQRETQKGRQCGQKKRAGCVLWRQVCVCGGSGSRCVQCVCVCVRAQVCSVCGVCR